MRSDEQSFVEFTYGPVYVVLELQDDTTVQVASSVLYKGIENPEERLDIDTERVVTREAWTAAVIETTNELIDEVVAINSAVKSTPDFELLREKLDKVTSWVDLGLNRCVHYSGREIPIYVPERVVTVKRLFLYGIKSTCYSSL